MVSKIRCKTQRKKKWLVVSVIWSQKLLNIVILAAKTQIRNKRVTEIAYIQHFHAVY